MVPLYKTKVAVHKVYFLSLLPIRGKGNGMASAFNPAQCKVALLCGGRSDEREISLKSGEGALNALNEAGFPVTVLDPAKKEDLVTLISSDFDVAFLCMHGKYGEDGTLQGLLEMINLPYTGSGVWSSALSMNKARTKLFYQNAGIPTPPQVWLRRGDAVDVDKIVEKVGEHCVVKAASGGSTIGIYIATKADEIKGYVDQAFEYDNDVIVEKFVAGEEFTIAVIGNDQPIALPIIKIVPKAGWYDFESKYAPGGSEHLCPAPISEELTQTLKELAVASHKALECSGVSRTDFIVDKEGGCWALETNSLPGMTKTSLLPDAARVQGISFPELCTMLIKFALE
jgi:D-alanine-D-alanine ligase